jgi:hypothetical protein
MSHRPTTLEPLPGWLKLLLLLLAFLLFDLSHRF